MGFVLSLLSFLLIVFGVLFTIASNNYTITNREKCTEEQIKKADNIMNRIRFYSLCAIILGIGIIVARIFS